MQLGNMVYHQTPEEFRCNVVIGMNNTITGSDNIPGIVKDYCRVLFQQLVDSLTHNFNIALHCTLP